VRPTPAYIAVGEMAPDFSLPRPDGGAARLSSYRGRQGVLLVFLRGFA
jgi:peroxiredoxin